MANVISIVIKAVDNASAVLSSTAAKLQGTADSMTAVGKSMTDVGKTASIGLSLPIAAVGAAAVYMAGNYQQSMAVLQSVTGATADQMAALGKQATALGNDVTLPGVSASGAASAMTELAKAGLTVNDVLTASKGVLALATAGQIDVQDAADTTAEALNAFGLQGSQATTIADLLAASANASTASVSDMALGLQMAGAQSHQMGVSLQDTVTALALFSNAGINGSDAGTSLKQMFLQLAVPTAQSSDLMKKLGLNFYDANGNFIGLSNTAQLLQTHLAGLTSEQKNNALATIFGSDATRVAAILADNGAAGFDKMSVAVNKQGAAADLAAAQNSGFKGALDNLISTVQTGLTSIGTTMMPALTQDLKEMGGAVAKLSGWFSGLSKGQQDLILRTAGWTAVIGPAVFIVGKLITGVTTLVLGFAKTVITLAKFGLSIASVLAKGALFAAQGAVVAAKWVAGAAQVVGSFLKTAGSAAVQAAKTSAVWIANSAKTVATMIIDAGKAAAAWAVQSAKMAADAAVNFAKMAASSVVSAASSAGSWIKAAHDSDIGLGGTLLKMVGTSISTAASFVKDAAVTSAAWIASAAKSSFAWVTTELPKIVAGAATTSASAVKEAAVSSAAWVKQAAVSSFAWVTTELPKILIGFVTTSGSAVKEAAVSSGAWVASAAVSSATWIAAKALIIAGYIETAAAAVASSVVTVASWVANAVAAGGYAVAIDTVKTNTYLFQALVSSPIAMGSIATAGALADIALVAAAVSSVMGAINAMNNAKQAADNQIASDNAVKANLQNLATNGTAAQKQRASNVYLELFGNVPKFAVGTEFAPTDSFIAGEHGPELITGAKGATVTPATQTGQMMGQGRGGVTIQNLNVNNNVDVNALIRKIGFKLATA